jgi:hypothetical protein
MHRPDRAAAWFWWERTALIEPEGYGLGRSAFALDETQADAELPFLGGRMG